MGFFLVSRWGLPWSFSILLDILLRCKFFGTSLAISTAPLCPFLLKIRSGCHPGLVMILYTRVVHFPEFQFFFGEGSVVWVVVSHIDDDFHFFRCFFLLFEVAWIILSGVCFRKLRRKFVGYSAFCGNLFVVVFYYSFDVVRFSLPR
jgi:hypothetical protein